MTVLNLPKVQIFAGHYGSGKTNLAVNMALALRAAGEEVTICDLDIVNPYFRTKDSEQELSRAGIRLLSPAYAGSSVDLPVVPPGAAAAFQGEGRVVIDLGGDDSGSVALGQFAHLVPRDDCAMYLVLNRHRFLTQTAEGALEIMREIESACHLPFTALVNNSNLGAESTYETLAQSEDYARAVAEKTGLPLAFTSVRADLLPEGADTDGVFPIRIMKKSGWEI